MASNPLSFEELAYQSIAKALLSDYVRVFYVDLSDESYVEMMPEKGGSELILTHTGVNFFENIRNQAHGEVYRMDLDRFNAAFHKENMMSLIEDAPLIITYRYLINKKPVWHTLKAMYADHHSHIMISVRNVDVQKRREADYENRLLTMSILVNRDALTSVKNKNAFTQEESKWNQELLHGEEETSFAIAVCDINNLKMINDTLGKEAGDQIVIDTSHLISDTFKHSPVFRIGGGEFAILLKEHDYEHREALVSGLQSEIRSFKATGGRQKPIVACGLATYDAAKDQSFGDVYRRAVARMHEDKKDLKQV